MPSSSLILIGVITPSSGILGSLVWPYFQRYFAYSNLRMLVILVGLASLIPAYGCLGFLPILQRAKFGGLTSPGEIYALAVYFGWYLIRYPCSVLIVIKALSTVLSRATPEPSMQN
jgi:UMF1 family MFS transporter